MSISRSLVTVNELLPPERQRRVFVDQAGRGRTVDHARLGNMIMGVGVLLDTGDRVFVAPDQVRVLTTEEDVAPSNVIALFKMEPV